MPCSFSYNTGEFTPCARQCFLTATTLSFRVAFSRHLSIWTFSCAAERPFRGLKFFLIPVQIRFCATQNLIYSHAMNFWRHEIKISRHIIITSQLRRDHMTIATRSHDNCDAITWQLRCDWMTAVMRMHDNCDANAWQLRCINQVGQKFCFKPS